MAKPTSFFIPPEMRETCANLFRHFYWLGYRDALLAHADVSAIAHVAEEAAETWAKANRVDFEALMGGAPTPAEPADD
jgi:hypothetical protein